MNGPKINEIVCIHDAELERLFLHDLATPLSIAKLTAVKLIQDLEALQSQDPQHSKTLERLKKILGAIHKMEELHGNHKIATSLAKASA